MTIVMFHVSDAANRESIRQHGLDWRRMGQARGIAGSPAPECEGIFLAEDMYVAKWFVDMGRQRDLRDVDVWEVRLDLDADVDFSRDQPAPPGTPLVRHQEGHICFLEPIPPECLQLVEPERLLRL